MLLEGLYIPLTTPFHPDGRLNPHKLAVNVLRYSKSPAAGLLALPPHAGEAALLTDSETRAALRTVAEAAAPEKVLLANISRDSLIATRELAEYAAEHAYDAVLVGPPRVLAPGQTRELLTFFRTLADRSPLPVILQSTALPEQTLAWSTILELARHPNILGLSTDQRLLAEPPPGEAAAGGLAALLSDTAAIRRVVSVTSTFAAVTGRMLRAAASVRGPQQDLVSAATLARNPAGAATAVAPPSAPASPLRTRTKEVGFQIVSSGAAHLLHALGRGASAIAPAFAACAPQTCYEVYAAWKDDDQPLAEEKQQRIVEPARLVEELGPGGLKFGCDVNGYFGGIPRLPFLPPDAAQRRELERRMAASRT
ncbi:MAG: dihydrodipicolinate synthase family protein [Acidobacteriota bacterium]|nr:dihydrodipicolinate synthase family protein [Acidobacteriota bacterium]